MAGKRPTSEGIVARLRQVDVLNSRGKTDAEAVRAIGVTEVTYYRWRKEYGGLKGDQVKRLKELEATNARLRRAVSDLTLDKLILAKAARRAGAAASPPRASTQHSAYASGLGNAAPATDLRNRRAILGLLEYKGDLPFSELRRLHGTLLFPASGS